MKQKIVNDIPLTVVESYGKLCGMVTDMLLKKIRKGSKINFLVPTGTTPLGIYQRLSQQSASLFRHTTFFNMDEYCTVNNGKVQLLPETDPRSYRYYMKTYFFNKIATATSYFPDETNAKQEGTYDELIKNLGGIDLCLTTVGEDGHVFGFNFPKASFSSRTRLVRINPETKAVNKQLTGQKIPDYAITTGIQTGMDAKEVLFIASGKRKAEILQKVLYKPINEAIPATILRTHSNCQWVVDKEAVSQL